MSYVFQWALAFFSERLNTMKKLTHGLLLLGLISINLSVSSLSASRADQTAAQLPSNNNDAAALATTSTPHGKISVVYNRIGNFSTFAFDAETGDFYIVRNAPQSKMRRKPGPCYTSNYIYRFNGQTTIMKERLYEDGATPLGGAIPDTLLGMVILKDHMLTVSRAYQKTYIYALPRRPDGGFDCSRAYRVLKDNDPLHGGDSSSVHINGYGICAFGNKRFLVPVANQYGKSDIAVVDLENPHKATVVIKYGQEIMPDVIPGTRWRGNRVPAACHNRMIVEFRMAYGDQEASYSKYFLFNIAFDANANQIIYKNVQDITDTFEAFRRNLTALVPSLKSFYCDFSPDMDVPGRFYATLHGHHGYSAGFMVGSTRMICADFGTEQELAAAKTRYKSPRVLSKPAQYIPVIK